MRRAAGLVAIILVLSACGEVVYTGLDESGRPIEQPTTTLSGAIVESVADLDLNPDVVDALAGLADAVGRLATAGRNLDGELAFLACTAANDQLDELADAGAPSAGVVGEAVATAATIAAECKASNSLRTYLNLADAAGESAGELRSLVRALEGG